jgi:hypothetical protein
MASSIPRARVLAGFRRLNRARIQIFRGDDHAMEESRKQLRDQIMANRSVPTSGPMFEELVNGLDEATQMLTHEIVRGDLNEQTGRYGTYDVFVFILSNNIFAIHIVV